MYGLTTIKGLLKRGRLMALTIALLISPAALHAQNGTSGPDFQFQGGIFVGLAKGQTLRLRIAQVNNQGQLDVMNDGFDDVIVGTGQGASGHVKVFDASNGALLYSYTLPRPIGGLRMIDIKREDLPAAGDTLTGRLRLWVEMSLVADPGKVLLQPSYEVMNTYTGVTTVQGGVLLVKSGTGTLVLSGSSNTYWN